MKSMNFLEWLLFLVITAYLIVIIDTPPRIPNLIPYKGWIVIDKDPGMLLHHPHIVIAHGDTTHTLYVYGITWEAYQLGDTIK